MMEVFLLPWGLYGFMGIKTYFTIHKILNYLVK